MEDARRTESIKNMVEHVENKNIVLPEFQRDFVWDIAKTYDLFDSLVRDVFIGSLIYGIPSFEITVREIDNRPRKQKGRQRKSLQHYNYSKDEVDKRVKIGDFRLILDGQQRITALYRAIKRIDNVWFIVRNADELAPEVTAKPIEKRNLEDILLNFTGQPDPRRMSINIADVWDIIEGKHRKESAKRELLEQSDYGVYIKSNSHLRYLRFEEVFVEYLIILDKLEDLFKAEKLISFYLLDTTQEKFALFFERSNSMGIRLNFVDILTAKLYGGFKLRKKTDEFEDENPNIRLSLQIVVRCIAYIVSDGKRVEQSYILQNLIAKHFNEHWKTICNLYKKSLNWLYDNNFIISQSWMPYENMLIPLIIFLRELPGHDFSQMSEKQHKFLIYWYWASIFSLRYSSASNEVIIQDSNVLSEVAAESKISDKSYFRGFRLQVTSKDDVLSLVKKQSAVYQGMLNLLSFGVNGLIDWQNTGRLSLNSNLEDHHIFPVGFLQEKYRDNNEVLEYIDCVANRTLIPKLTNIKIGKKPPSAYLVELKKKNPKIITSLENHLIPDPEDFIEGLYDDFYSDFLDERAEALFQLVNKNVISVQSDIEKEFGLQLPPVDISDGVTEISEDENPTGQKIKSFTLCGETYKVDTWRTMLLKVCEFLINRHGADFSKEATKLKGTKRHYISYNPNELREPTQINGTDLWIETNLSAQQTMSVIFKMLDTFGHDRSKFAVFRDG